MCSEAVHLKDCPIEYHTLWGLVLPQVCVLRKGWMTFSTPFQGSKKSRDIPSVSWEKPLPPHPSQICVPQASGRKGKSYRIRKAGCEHQVSEKDAAHMKGLIWKYNNRRVTSTSSSTCITQAPVTDNSEGSKPPWSLKVWVGLEGQIRNEKESQKNTLQLGKWGLVGKNQKVNILLGWKQSPRSTQS